jgi:hypothetical protein
VLPPDQQVWFDGWRSRNKKFCPRIELVTGAQMRTWLQQPDNQHVRDAYFPLVEAIGLDVEVAPLPDPAEYSGSLFVAQLEEAGRLETDAAKGYFFAAEAMARDVASRGLPAEMSALSEVQLEVHGIWEDQFNSLAPSADVDGRMSGLIDGVIRDAGALPISSDLRLRPAHRRGLMHRLVNSAKAGWVTHWRKVAAGHTRASETESPTDVDEKVLG